MFSHDFLAQVGCIGGVWVIKFEVLFFSSDFRI